MPTDEREDDYVDDARFVVGAARDLPVVEKPWDAAAARGRLFGDVTFSDAKRGHFVYDADNAEVRSAYKLPFADIVEGRLVAVASAVRNAAARLDQTQIPAPVRRRIRTIIAGYLDRAREARERGDTGAVGDPLPANGGERRYADEPADEPVVERGLRRYDRGQLRKKSRYDESTGFLHVDATLTRAPAVFDYRNADGSIRRELRRPAHVFSNDNLKRMATATVTLHHPPVRVTSKNIRKFGVGHGDGAIRVEDDHAIAGLVLTDDDAISAVKGGVREMSCGYDCDVIMSPGVWTDPGGTKHHFDAEQINHRNNHNALVESGRAGTTPVHLDRTDAMQVGEENMAEDTKQPRREDFLFSVPGNENKARVKIDGLDIELPIEQARLVAEDQRKKADEVQAAKDRADTLEAERDKASKDLEAATEKLKTATSEDQLQARVDARRSLFDRAAMFVTDAKDLEALKSKTDAEIKLECVKAANAGVSLEGKSEVYIDAMFDLLQPKKGNSMAESGRKIMGAASSETDERKGLDKRINDAMDDHNTWHRKAVPGGMTSDGKSPSRSDALHG